MFSEDAALFIVLGVWGFIGVLALTVALLQKRRQKTFESTNCNVVSMHRHRKRRI